MSFVAGVGVGIGVGIGIRIGIGIGGTLCRHLFGFLSSLSSSLLCVWNLEEARSIFPIFIFRHHLFKCNGVFPEHGKTYTGLILSHLYFFSALEILITR
jgi:hypothetical protein